MIRTQYQSRRKWGILPDGGSYTVLWWRVKGGIGVVFTEYLTDEPKRSREDQEKDFIASMKGYGEILQRKEYITKELDKG